MTLSVKTCDLLYAKGHQLYNNGKWKEAITFFQILTLQRPDEKKYWLALGASYQMINDDKSALSNYAMATLIEPEDANTHLLSAECFYRLGDYVNSNRALESAKHILNRNQDSEANKRFSLLKELLENSIPKKY